MVSAAKNKATKNLPKTSLFLTPKTIGDKIKSSSKKEKPVSHFPIEGKCNQPSLSDLMDQFAAANEVSNAAQRKVAEHKAAIKGFLLENFARAWAGAKDRPPTRTWKAIRSSVDYVMTSYINFTASKQEEIEQELGIDMSNYFEVTGFKIDLETLKSNEKYFNAFMAFIGEMSEEDVQSDKYVERSFKLKKSFFNRLSDICDNNPDRLYSMLQILDPRANLKNVSSSDQEENLFDFVRNMKG